MLGGIQYSIMNTSKSFKILIISDNPSFQENFRNILSPTKTNLTKKKVEYISEDNFLNKIFNEDTPTISLTPEFKLDFVFKEDEAISLIRKSHDLQKPYSLVFVNSQTPTDTIGVRTITKIWKIDSNIQVIICTDYFDHSWEKACESFEFNDQVVFLKRPFDTIEVRQLVIALIEKWSLKNLLKDSMRNLHDLIKRKTVDLEHTLSLINATLDATTDGIFVISNEGEIIKYNRTFLEMWSIPTTSLPINDAHHILEHITSLLKEPEIFTEKLKEIVTTPNSESFMELELKSHKIFECYSLPQRINRKLVGHVFSFRNITERRKFENHLAHQATHDTLTNLPNRLLLFDRIQQAINQAKRNDSLIGIMFFDLDKFKIINDSLGHDIGDVLLQQVAKRLKKSIRESDTIARLGGDEFVVLLPTLKSPEDCFPIIDKCLKAIGLPFQIGNRTIHTSTSIGISIFPEGGLDASSLVKNADIAMYRAKKMGPNNFQFYSPDLKEP